jgi:hypothetical protein
VKKIRTKPLKNNKSASANRRITGGGNRRKVARIRREGMNDAKMGWVVTGEIYVLVLCFQGPGAA